MKGFARMESNLDRSVTGVPWVDKETIRLGHPFKIKWHRFSEVPFNKIKNHVNTLNVSSVYRIMNLLLKVEILKKYQQKQVDIFALYLILMKCPYQQMP